MMRQPAPLLALFTAAALGLSACGGETGQAVQDRAEKEARGGLDKAVTAAKRDGRDRALREIDRLERRAKRELRTNGARRIEEAADRARSEVRRRAR